MNTWARYVYMYMQCYTTVSLCVALYFVCVLKCTELGVQACKFTLLSSNKPHVQYVQVNIMCHGYTYMYMYTVMYAYYVYIFLIAFSMLFCG